MSASGTPIGGSYSWSRTPNLTPNGSTATLTGFQSTFSEYIGVTGYYTTPKGKTCSDKKWIWVCLCDVSIDNAPTEANVGEEITMTASNDLTGGTYQWSLSTGTGSISGSDNSATFIGDTVGEVEIRVDYTPPEGGEPCKAFHTITVVEECSVTIAATPWSVPLGGSITLVGEGMPEGGIWQWDPVDGLIPAGGHATYTPSTAGNHILAVNYTTPDGQECTDSTVVIAYKVQSLTSKNACFASDDTLTKSDFALLTMPTGYEDRISFEPTTVSTTFQTEDVTVTGSCGEGTLDNATTTVTVVNHNQKISLGSEIDFKIPDYFSEALTKLGLADKSVLNFSNSLSETQNCCNLSSIKKNRELTFSAKIEAELGPFTILGFPLPPTLKDYVTLDALAISIEGGTGVELTGNYNDCSGITQWGGFGILSATVSAGGEVKVKVPGKAIIFEGSLGSATGITESVSTECPNLILSGRWDGVTISGKVHIKVLHGLKIGPINVSHILLQEKPIPTISIPLPSLTP